MNSKGTSAWRRMFRTKPAQSFVTETGADAGSSELSRSIGLFTLTMFGVGATVGTGIFIVLPEAVPEAGPAVIVSFLLAGITAALTAMCYAELASTIPASGSAYSYAYATLGEIVAFGVAACLLLEYGVSAAAVSVGWAQYLNELFSELFGFQIPGDLMETPWDGGILNLPAVVLVTACCLLLVRGARESATANAIMVLIKLAVLVMFAAIAFMSFSAGHFTPFAPLGLGGIGAAAASIFFSFIGLDAVSTAGEEVRNPTRNLPLAIMFATLIVTCVYILVAVSGIGAQPWQQFAGQKASLATILASITGANWPASVLSVGAVISIFSVTLVVLYGQTRILFAMGRDGMLPETFHKVNPTTLVPVRNTVIVGLFVGILAGFIPLNVLLNLTSMGTLVAFTVVSIGVIVLRRTSPDLPRGFRVPLFPVLPIISAAFALYLIGSLPRDTHVLFIVWLVGAAIIYFAYSFRHSRLRNGADAAIQEPSR